MNKSTKPQLFLRENGTLKMTNDVVFRMLFGTNKYQRMLIQFLKNVLGLSQSVLSKDFLDTIKTENDLDKLIESREDVW